MSTKISFTRRHFLQSLGLSLLGFGVGSYGYNRLFKSKRLDIPGSMVGANSRVGHLLKKGIPQTPTQTRAVDTVIVGGGISGLSAGWWLRKEKFDDFVLLEMDSHVGGNSIHGENNISKYPWGAHYIPVPGENAEYVRLFFEEIGIIKGYRGSLPIYDDYFLCADSQERLFFQGSWQDGLVPQDGISDDDKRQYLEFFALIDGLKRQSGADGKPVFAIPIDFSSRDQEFLKLDRLSMAEFMKSKGWKSRYLNWYVNYCCRDDYGMPHDRVSAWAGLHYFASRSGAAANADSQAVITCPEGNGYFAVELEKRVKDHIKRDSLVFSVENLKDKCLVNVLDTKDDSCTQYIANNVIYAGPRYTASKVIKNYHSDVDLEYAPWLIANISVSDLPESHGAPLSWDNVSFYSQSLGYIVANHQDLTFNHKEKVLTYYHPLDGQSPKEERKAAYHRSDEEWLEIVLADLGKMHPGIEHFVSNVDLWLWGHGMVSPGIDQLWSEKRRELLKPFGRVVFAHSDMSCISIFEEAQYRGVEAAKTILSRKRA